MLDQNAWIYSFDALTMAVIEHNLERITTLLSRGCSPNVTNQVGVTPLMAAASKGHTDVVALLLDAGADPNLAELRGGTALMIASTKGYTEIAEQLLAHGASVYATDTLSRTALTFAAHHGHLGLVKLLTEKGAVVDARDDSSWTPLYAAAYEGHTDVVEHLLEQGADIDTVTRLSWVPLFAAYMRKHAAVIMLLLDHGAATHQVCLETPFSQTTQTIFQLLVLFAAQTGHQSMMSKLLGIHPNALEISINTHFCGMAMHAAAANNQLEMVEYMVSQGTSTEQTDRSDETPLFKALAKSHLQMLERLIALGANINAVNCEGDSLLHYAISGKNDGALDLLLKHHASLTVKNHKQETLLDIALMYDNAAALKRLVMFEPLEQLEKRVLHQKTGNAFNTKIICQAIKIKQAPQLWQQHAAHPKFNRLLRYANIGLFATCKNPTEQTQLPLDILYQISKHQLEDFDTARRFTSAVDRHKKMLGTPTSCMSP